MKVKGIFYSEYVAFALYCYYLLDKKIRIEFKNELEPLSPETIKLTKRLGLKICLFLASKGIEFPLKLRECVRKMYVKIKY
jgi:hypothetical protein